MLADMRGVTALLLAVLIVAGGVGVGWGTPAAAERGVTLDAGARQQFVRGLAAFRAGRHREAAREFSDPIWAATPLHDYAVLYHAESLTRVGDTTGARAALAPLLAPAVSGRLASSALLQAAALAIAAGDDAAAAVLYRRFVERHPDHADTPRARLALGDALAATDQRDAAATVYFDLWLEAPAASQANEAARRLRALTERGVPMPAPTHKERLERAERLLAGRDYHPARSEAETLLGESLSAEWRDRAFRVSFESARRPGQYDAALAIAGRALLDLPADKRPQWLLEQARLMQRRGREQALAVIDRLVRQFPKSPQAAEALLLKAEMYESVSRSADAHATYTQLAQGYPEENEAGTALWRLGWSAWFKKSIGEAATRWGQILRIRGGQNHREGAAYWSARAAEARGDREQAARQYAQLLAEAPRGYYGVLASQRGSKASGSAPAVAVTLPVDPLELLRVDGRYARIEAMRAVGLGELADEELDDMTRLSLGDPKRLYAISAAWTQEARYHMAIRILKRHFYGVARTGSEAAPRAFWEMLYPIGWPTELAGAARRAAVDPLLVAAVVREESAYDPRARSRVGARGLMQLMPATAKPLARARGLEFADGDLLDDPAANLDMGAAFYAGLLREFRDPRLATAAYNAGPGRVREWWGGRRSDDVDVFVEHIPFNETRGFVKRVTVSWDEYRRLYGRRLPADEESTTR
jgi:soluble lytic murein transglycosylase